MKNKLKIVAIAVIALDFLIISLLDILGTDLIGQKTLIGICILSTAPFFLILKKSMRSKKPQNGPSEDLKDIIVVILILIVLFSLIVLLSVN